MCLRQKRAGLIAGCLGIAMLCAAVVVKTQGAGEKLPVWKSVNRNAAEEMPDQGNAVDSENSINAQDEIADDMTSQSGAAAGADSQKQKADIAEGQGNTDSTDSVNGQEESDVAGRGDMSIKKVALTFDDGPHPRYTDQLLEGLRERDVRVTFFVLGQCAELYPDLIREMAQDGHLIGNHTYSHVQLTGGNGQQFTEELQKTDAIIYELTGEHTEFVRPPYGAWDKRYEESLNMIQVLWTVDPLDWCCADAGTVISRVLDKADEDCIILLHDVYASSVEAALAIIDELSARGYEFVTVDEIILD